MPVSSALYPSPAGLFGSLLPSWVVAAESAGEASGAGAGLFPAEKEAVRTAGPGRQADFTAGRLCARAALARLGVTAAPILPGPAGEPQWPAGVTGSITHCAGYRACAVALTTDVTAIGIDAEPGDTLPAGLHQAVATPSERARIAVLSAASAVPWDRLLFSAKEAACKLWYPLTGQWPALHDVAAALVADGTFTVRVRGAGPVACPWPEGRIKGRWVARGGLIATAITWPSAASAGPPGRAR
ncbi:MAG: 4'-phosphopantetheinyl transferase family protein [Micromonosporaceae bacterium]